MLQSTARMKPLCCLWKYPDILLHFQPSRYQVHSIPMNETA